MFIYKIKMYLHVKNVQKQYKIFDEYVIVKSNNDTNENNMNIFNSLIIFLNYISINDIIFC